MSLINQIILLQEVDNKLFEIEMGLDEMVQNIGTDPKLLEYEDKIYSNFTHLKDSYDKQ